MSEVHTEPSTTAASGTPEALLVTIHGTVRRAELTPLGHLSCQLDAGGQTYSALGDPIVAHLVELQPGTRLRAVLLRMRRARPEAPWHWYLLCCRVEASAQNEDRVEHLVA